MGVSSLRWVRSSCMATLVCVVGLSAPAMVVAVESTEVAQGVHVFIGATGEASPQNRGEVGNTGFVVGETGTVMINSGASYRHGRALLEAAERIGGKPVMLLIITQPLQEFVMGTAAFVERGVPVLAHVASAKLIESRCEVCLHKLTQLLGEAEMAGTRVEVPTRQVVASQTLEVGGRVLELLHPGWGSSPGDLIVRDSATGVVFTGALVSIGRVPELRDGNVQGWLAALEHLENNSAGTIVPGYGHPVLHDSEGPSSLSPLKAYISETNHSVRALLQAGVALSAATDLADADHSSYAGWALYTPVHGRNVQHLYLQAERELLDQ